MSGIPRTNPHPTNDAQGFFCVQCNDVMLPQNRVKPDITGSYGMAHFLHMMHGQGVGEFFGVSSFEIEVQELEACHALLCRIRRTLELEFVSNFHRANWDKQIDADRAKAFSNPAFLDHYKRNGIPLYVYDERHPRHRPPPCNCSGCTQHDTPTRPYAELVETVSKALKKALRAHSSSYFVYATTSCEHNLSYAMGDVGRPLSSVFEHWYHHWTPLSIEVGDDKNIYFVVKSITHDINEYIANWLYKSFGERARNRFRREVVDECVQAFFLKNVAI